MEGHYFQHLKQVLSPPLILRNFDPQQRLELQCDASEKGLGACLLGGQPLTYASTSLSETEQNYAQIEKEMLAILFGTEQFEQNVYGRKVKVETDHKPLESILKSLLSAQKRLQRMMLRLLKFNLDMVYKKGKEMYLADTLSRAFLSSPSQAAALKDTMSIGHHDRNIAEDVESLNMLTYLPVSEDTLNLSIVHYSS